MVAYDPFAPEVLEDPHPIYKRLRREDPVHYIERFDAFALARFADIWNASSNPALSTAKGTTPSQLLTRVQPVTPMLNLMDPPEHTALRSAVKPYFAPRRVRELEPTIRSLIGEYLDKVRETGRCDAMNDLAQQVSVRVACTAIGIPLSDSDHLNALVWRFFAREPGVEGMTEDGLRAAEELSAYFLDLVARRRRAGSECDDVVDLFCRFELGGRRFTPEEVASHLSMLIIGGSETFPKTYANALYRLWEHPEQRAECVRDPALIPHAYEEALRYDMPTQFLGRTAVAELEIGGRRIRPGQVVLFLYPSANRDELEFEDPDRFDIHRRPARILSFGAGTHACLGLHIARMEGRVSLEETLQRMPEYEVLPEESERLRTEFVQGFARLALAFDPW